MRRGALGLLFLVAGCGGETAARPNLILISIDTLRADRLGCYGHGRDTSPAIDRLAERAVLFEDVLAECSWTIPSHVTMLSGLHPARHGVETPEHRPSDEVPMLAEVLAAAGYYTVAITDGGWLSPDFGFGRGFRSFHDERRGFADTLVRAREYVEFRRPRGPFFAFLHTYDVHCPYDPPEPWRSRYRAEASVTFEADGLCGNPDLNAMELGPGELLHLSDRYDAGVRWADDAFAEFLAFLEDEDLFEDTVVVLTSDHGEELGEHGTIGHEGTLHREALGVPLIVAAPGLAPRRVADPVGLVDLVPTVLALLGVSGPAGDGRSLVSSPPGGDSRDDGRLGYLRWRGRLDSWNQAGRHLVVDRQGGGVSESGHEAPGSVDEDRGRLERRLDALARSRVAPETGSPPVDARLAELRALGYGD